MVSGKFYGSFLLGCILASWSSFGSAEIIFSESFDDLADFTSTMYGDDNPIERSKGDVLPEGWDGLYQGTEWSPETGHPDKHASLEILAKNSDKAKGGTGKSAVNWRESFSKGWKNWASDSQLVKILDKGYEELYFEFEIRFSPNWWQRGLENTEGYTSKIFRVGSWSGSGSPFSGYGGEVGPIALWDYKRDSYGVRNVLGFRGGPHGENYNFNNEYSGGSFNYTSHTEGQGDSGRDPQLRNLTDGGYLVDFPGSTTHEQVFGPTERWTKMSFYVKMNSRPGATDGVFRQWVDGVQIVNRSDIPWVQENPENKMVKWNYFAIGGNDYFQPFPNDERFEDWYAIDNVIVRTSIPDDIAGGASGIVAPRPPVDLRAQ